MTETTNEVKSLSKEPEADTEKLKFTVPIKKMKPPNPLPKEFIEIISKTTERDTSHLKSESEVISTPVISSTPFVNPTIIIKDTIPDIPSLSINEKNSPNEFNALVKELKIKAATVNNMLFQLEIENIEKNIPEDESKIKFQRLNNLLIKIEEQIKRVTE